MDFEQIKREKKQMGFSRLEDMIALSRGNDPFFIGTPAHIAGAEWFADVWKRFGYSDGVHLRRIHYQIASQKNKVLRVDGTPYENTKESWNELGTTSKHARWLGLVTPSALVDRRNGEPHIFFEPVQPEIELTVEDEFYYGGMEIPDFPSLPDYDISGFESEQRYHLELWAEKSTMNDILLPLCRSHKLNLVTGLGEMSITQCDRLFHRIQSYGKLCRIFYISDFDPAGRSMPVAVARKIEKFIEDTEFDVKLMPVVLTHEQCKKYELPRIPIKESELRAAGFEKRFGAGATELDALEALHPGELRKILAPIIKEYRDDTLSNRVQEAQGELLESLSEIRKKVLENHEDDIEDLQAEYDGLAESFSGAFSEFSTRAENVWHGIQQDLEEEAPDLSGYNVPEATVSTEPFNYLFDSKRGYYEQLEHYKKFQGKFTRPKKKPPVKIDQKEINKSIHQIMTNFTKTPKPEDGSESTKRSSPIPRVGLHLCDCVESA